MMRAYMLFSDLDRTLLPNGVQPESPQARPALRALLSRSEMMLTYVSGRDEALLRQAINEYSLPTPQYAVGDVGTTIYEVQRDRWVSLQEWQAMIGADWGGAKNKDIAALLAEFTQLRLQEPEKQNTFKLSYYADLSLNYGALLEEMQSVLFQQGMHCSVIWSVDEAAQLGLLDVLPACATKLHAVEFLMQRMNISVENSVFAGDSGNDLPVISSGRLQTVLVKNAHPDVIAEAKEALARLGAADRLYVASGDFYGLNGNYCAGVLEGLAHYLPNTLEWMQLN